MDNYRLKSITGKLLRTVQHGSNLKRFHTPLQKACTNTAIVCPESTEVRCEEEELTVIFQTAPRNELFAPTTSTWRKSKCVQLQLPASRAKHDRRVKKAIGEPLSVRQIVGDGNCLFRAISYEVTLSEEHHAFFRAAACSILRDERYSSMFEAAHIPRQMSVNNYINVTNMEKLGTWGTDVEIFALATLLNTKIVVYYRPATSDTFSWYTYRPMTPSDKVEETSIYLRNLGNHFERVNSVVPSK